MNSLKPIGVNNIFQILDPFVENIFTDSMESKLLLYTEDGLVLSEDQYEALRKIINDTAERVRALGHYEQGSLKEFLKVARLNEENESSSDEHFIIQKLLEDHEAVIRSIGKDINIIADDYEDLGTALFTTGIMEHHEKMA